MCIWGGREGCYLSLSFVWPLDWTPLVPAFLDSVFQFSFIWNKFSYWILRQLPSTRENAISRDDQEICFQKATLIWTKMVWQMKPVWLTNQIQELTWCKWRSVLAQSFSQACADLRKRKLSSKEGTSTPTNQQEGWISQCAWDDSAETITQHNLGYQISNNYSYRVSKCVRSG